jgi:hypothetical protein
MRFRRRPLKKPAEPVKTADLPKVAMHTIGGWRQARLQFGVRLER